MSFTHTVQSWFERKGGGCLFLPYDSYGKPMDNQHRLTALKEVDGKLEISLDDKLVLRFEGLTSVEARGNELVFGPFDRFEFDREDYGLVYDGKTTEYRLGRATTVYRSGEVRIVSASINSHSD